jgi:hypothetical protein
MTTIVPVQFLTIAVGEKILKFENLAVSAGDEFTCDDARIADLTPGTADCIFGCAVVNLAPVTAEVPILEYLTLGNVTIPNVYMHRSNPFNGDYGGSNPFVAIVFALPITTFTTFDDYVLRFKFSTPLTPSTKQHQGAVWGCARGVQADAIDLTDFVSNYEATIGPTLGFTLDLPERSTLLGDATVSFCLDRSGGTFASALANEGYTSRQYTTSGTANFIAAGYKTQIAQVDDEVLEWASAIGPLSNQVFFASAFTLPAYGRTPAGDATVFNCDCVDDTTFQPRQTLAQLRRRFLIQTGFAAQADNPPASMVTLANELLLTAQTDLYMKYPALNTRRFFRWPLVQGTRFYGLGDNDDDIDCGFSFNPYKAIEWVGVSDPQGVWLPMTQGIPPEVYTMAAQQGIPQLFDIRQCIEVYPAPDADGYHLWIKGHFGLAAFASDSDQTTIDSEAVLLWAVALRKKATGAPDADAIASIAKARIGDLTAGTHGKKRYIPNTVVLPPMAQPLFLPLLPGSGS